MTAEEKREKFIVAYNEYTDEIFRYFYFRVYDRDKALELAQEAFTKAWKYISDGKEVTYMKAFLYKVAYHMVIDYSRKKKEQSLDAMMEDGFDVGVNDKNEVKDMHDVLAALQEIDKLDEKYQEVLRLRYVEGLSPKDIAHVVGQSENVVSVRIHRGMKQLRVNIE